MSIPIPLSDIDIDLEWNTRHASFATGIFHEIDDEGIGLEGLKENLVANGQLTPVDVRLVAPPFYKVTSKKFSLVTGFRRATAVEQICADETLRAEAKAAGRTIVPRLPDGCILANVHEAMSEKSAFLLNAVENANRENLTPLETCLMVKRGIEVHGFTPQDLAAQLGKNHNIVKNYARVANLPPSILDHWTGKRDDFEGSRTSKRVGIQDMFLIAKTSEHEQLDAYKRAIEYRVACKRTSPFVEKARRRATGIATILARLEARGMIDVHDTQWARYIEVIAGVSKQLPWKDAEDLAQAAKAAYEREMGLAAK